MYLYTYIKIYIYEVDMIVSSNMLNNIYLFKKKKPSDAIRALVWWYYNSELLLWRETCVKI